MKTFVKIEEGIVRSVVVCAEGVLANEGEFTKYPYPSDLGGPSNIAGKSIAEFEVDGNFKEKADGN